VWLPPLPPALPSLFFFFFSPSFNPNPYGFFSLAAFSRWCHSLSPSKRSDSPALLSHRAKAPPAGPFFGFLRSGLFWILALPFSPSFWVLTLLFLPTTGFFLPSLLSTSRPGLFTAPPSGIPFGFPTPRLSLPLCHSLFLSDDTLFSPHPHGLFITGASPPVFSDTLSTPFPIFPPKLTNAPYVSPWV